MFRATLLVRSLKLSLRQPKTLVIRPDPCFGKVNLLKDDCIHNVVTEETALKVKKDGTMWRGPKEKSVSLLELFITSLSPNEGIVVDLTAGTGEAFSFDSYYDLILLRYSIATALLCEHSQELLFARP